MQYLNKKFLLPRIAPEKISFQKYLLCILLFITSIISSIASPNATITSPSNGTKYKAGQTIKFSGTATDPQEGDLPLENYEWLVWFHHESHWHDEPPFLTGADKGSIHISGNGETSANVYYRLYLIVTNSSGDSDTDYVDLKPETAVLTLHTVPEGLIIRNFETTLSTPNIYSTVQNMGWHISVDSVQTLASDGRQYVFDHWEDNNTLRYINFAMPAKDTSITAYYKIVTGIEKEDLFNVNIFPNPAHDQLTIQCKFPTDYISISITDLISKELKKNMTLQVVNNIAKLDLSGINSGIYYIKVFFKDAIFTKKIIIQ